MRTLGYFMSDGCTISLGQRPASEEDVHASLAWLADFTDDELDALGIVMLDILRTPQPPGADLSVPAYWVGAISHVRGKR